MSGGFTPGLRRSEFEINGGPSFLASEHYGVKRGGVTVAASTVKADSNGDKVLKAGTFVTPITSGEDVGKYGPYDASASDGRETASGDVSLFLLESINLKDGDVICGGIIHGSVLGARVTPSPLPAAARTAIAGRITVQ